jgi:broad specificity phosphatase PhoE
MGMRPSVKRFSYTLAMDLVMTEPVSKPSIPTDSTLDAAPKAGRVQLWLVRHGQTAWSLSGQHTGRTDLPLTPAGEQQARDIGKLLGGRSFATVLTSPLLRARETCRLAGYSDHAVIDPNLQEWNYGDYEGKTSAEIQKERPGWSLWKDGVVHGESIEQVAARAQAVIDRAVAGSGDALLFAHGHLLRILTSCWLGLPPRDGSLFALGTGTLTTLGYEHVTRVITRMNAG